MSDTKEFDYKKSVRDRLKDIMIMIGLEIPGFALLLNKSESHIYAVLNGTRELTIDLAKEIGAILEFNGENIFKLTYPIPERITKSRELNNFMVKYKDNPEYFSSTIHSRKKSKYIEKLIDSGVILIQPANLNDIRKKVNSLKPSMQFTSDQLSKILNYLVKKQKLSKVREPMKIKGDKIGKRKVDLFSRSSNAYSAPSI